MRENKMSIALGVTGSIAAYKAAELTSRLTQEGFEVFVLMTSAAQKLVTPRTFLTLSRNPVISDLWEMPDWQPGHIALAEKVELLLVAPCSANFIGKLAHGIADDALTTFALSHTGPVLLAPAMNPKMWRHPAVQENCKILAGRGVKFIGPESGPVACGEDQSPGRMAEPRQIIAAIKDLS